MSTIFLLHGSATTTQRTHRTHRTHHNHHNHHDHHVPHPPSPSPSSPHPRPLFSRRRQLVRGDGESDGAIEDGCACVSVPGKLSFDRWRLGFGDRVYYQPWKTAKLTLVPALAHALVLVRYRCRTTYSTWRCRTFRLRPTRSPTSSRSSQRLSCPLRSYERRSVKAVAEEEVGPKRRGWSARRLSSAAEPLPHYT